MVLIITVYYGRQAVYSVALEFASFLALFTLSFGAFNESLFLIPDSISSVDEILPI